MFEVFLSYSRNDMAARDRVTRILRGPLGLSVFVDEDAMAGGFSFNEQIDRTLRQAGVTPMVVLLASADAARSEAVKMEVAHSRKNGLVVIPIQLTGGATAALLGDREIHYLDASLGDDVLELRLRVSLTEPVRRRLDLHRRAAFEWVERLHSRTTTGFWRTDEERRILDPAKLRGVAIVAHGGSGKSVLISSALRSLERDRGVYPVVVEPESLHDADMDVLLKSLGARDAASLGAHLTGVSQASRARGAPLDVLFVVDGLDRVSPRGDVPRWLKCLSDAAPTVIGCRPEIWDIYRSLLSVETLELQPLSPAQVQAILEARGAAFAKAETPLLQIPLFLDIALSNAERWEKIPQTRTEFLEAAITTATAEKEVVPGRALGGRFLEALARVQLETMRYDVDFGRAEEEFGSREDWPKAFDALRPTGLVVETRRSNGQRLVRLRHDLLDNHVIATLLLDADDGPRRRAQLLERLAEGCAWPMAASLIVAAKDLGRTDVFDELFDESLRILDRKPEGQMARAWGVTFALKSSIAHALDAILDVLGICADADPTPDGGVPGSSRARGERRLTQVAASTLASVLPGLGQGTRAQGEAAVPVLVSILTNRRWRLRKRIVEALALFDTDAARDAVIRFGESELALEQERDLEVFDAVVAALRARRDPDAVRLLEGIVRDEEIQRDHPRIQRAAIHSLVRATGRRIPEPPVGASEIVAGLIASPDQHRYSDWKVVKLYADHVRDHLQRGSARYEADVLKALIRALDHPQTFVRSPVAEALGEFDDPLARDALAHEVLEDDVPIEVWRSCVAALARQLAADSDGASRQRRKVVMLETARLAGGRGRVDLETALSDAALGTHARAAGDWYVDHAAAQTCGLDSSLPFHCCVVDDAPVASGIDALVTDEERLRAGPAWEDKYRLVALASGRVMFARFDWPTARGFHEALRTRRDEIALLRKEVWRLPVPLGDAVFPGIASVHCVVHTKDDKLLLARRSATVAYWPGAWSASFEDQLTTADFHDEDAIRNAARRGFREELGDHEIEAIAVAGTLLELEILNTSFVVLLRTGSDASQLAERWRTDPRPSHHEEAADLAWSEFSPEALVAWSEEGGIERRLHPTSLARMRIVAGRSGYSR